MDEIVHQLLYERGKHSVNIYRVV